MKTRAELQHFHNIWLYISLFWASVSPSFEWDNNACLFSYCCELHNQSHLNSTTIVPLFLIQEEAFLRRDMSHQQPIPFPSHTLGVPVSSWREQENKCILCKITSILPALVLEIDPSISVLMVFSDGRALYGCTCSGPHCFLPFQRYSAIWNVIFLFHSPILTLPIYIGPFLLLGKCAHVVFVYICYAMLRYVLYII